jgi:hypothetical protein
MSYGHAERNLALIRQLEAETAQLLGGPQPRSIMEFRAGPVATRGISCKASAEGTRAIGPARNSQCSSSPRSRGQISPGFLTGVADSLEYDRKGQDEQLRRGPDRWRQKEKEKKERRSDRGH